MHWQSRLIIGICWFLLDLRRRVLINSLNSDHHSSLHGFNSVAGLLPRSWYPGS
jgi:hypothetical protein